MTQQQNPLYKKATQSLQSYKQRLDKKIQTQYQSGEIGRTMAMSTYLIEPTWTNSSLLFPIRRLLPSQIEQIKSNIRSQYRTDYYDPYLRQPQNKPPHKKIPYYLFSHLSHNFEILRDDTFTIDEKIQLIHLRTIIQDYLIFNQSNQQLNARRIKNIINSLESPIIVKYTEQIIRPLNQREITNLLTTLDYLLFNYRKLPTLKKYKHRQKN